jgi:5-deoxy-glucuronate isomerase
MKEPKDWNYTSPDSSGFHTVVSPQNSICKQVHIFRLNLEAQQHFSLLSHDLELNGAVIEGDIDIVNADRAHTLVKCDSFYLPPKNELMIKARNKTIVFIGGARYEEKGEFYVRTFDLNSPDTSIRQVHGVPPYRRDVFMTVSPADQASRLICGITWGDPGMWTSWPPHQHTKDLEEVYCYFNLPKPKFALHLSSRIEGIVEHAHPVSTGSCVIVPEGYHPTVAMPGVKSCYFWVMAAHTLEGRRYDLAMNDPQFAEQ